MYMEMGSRPLPKLRVIYHGLCSQGSAGNQLQKCLLAREGLFGKKRIILSLQLYGCIFPGHPAAGTRGNRCNPSFNGLSFAGYSCLLPSSAILT